MRISEVIGERIRTSREDLGWTQAELGRHVGARLGQSDWSRQVMSAAEQGKRAYTAEELLAFADVLKVSIMYLMTPPPELDAVKFATGAPMDTMAVVEAVTTFRGTDTAEEHLAETGLAFFQSIADLRQVLDAFQARYDAFIDDLRAVHAAQASRNAAPDAGERES